LQSKSRDENYKPKLLSDVTEELQKERQHEKDKDGDSVRSNDRDLDRERDLKRTKDVFINEDDDDGSPAINKRRKVVPSGENKERYLIW